MSESADFYMSWLGCSAFGAAGTLKLRAPEPIIFAPTDLSDCSVWFDAGNPSSLTLEEDNTSIITWNNLGTSLGQMIPYAGTGYSGVDTINGLNTVQFAERKMMQWYGSIPNQAKTCFVVFKSLNDILTLATPYINLTNGEAYQGLQLGVYGNAGTSTIYYSICQSGDWCNSISTSTNPYTVPTYISFRIDTDVSNNFIKIDGVPGTMLDFNAAGYFNTSPITYTFNRNDGSSIDLGELIIYSRALSAPEVTQVETYLAAKWGIT